LVIIAGNLLIGIVATYAPYSVLPIVEDRTRSCVKANIGNP
jgi:hypothetical protein